MENQNLHNRFFLSKKVKMRLKCEIKCVLCTEKMFNTYMPRDGLKTFDREFWGLKIRHAPSG